MRKRIAEILKRVEPEPSLPSYFAYNTEHKSAWCRGKRLCAIPSVESMGRARASDQRTGVQSALPEQAAPALANEQNSQGSSNYKSFPATQKLLGLKEADSYQSCRGWLAGWLLLTKAKNSFQLRAGGTGLSPLTAQAWPLQVTLFAALLRLRN